MVKKRTPVKRYYFVRHGSTDWVENHIVHGISDIPLNNNGLRQAGQAAKALSSVNASHIITSRLSRCQQTADTIGKELNLAPQIIAGFEEMNFGWLEGRPYRDHVKQNHNFLIRFWDLNIHRFVRVISGETQEKFKKRILKAWEKITDLEDPIVIVGHGLAINKIFIRLFGQQITKGHEYYPFSPCGISEVLIDDLGKAELVRFDDHSHITTI
jgi:broad specificity phosphatase PhoE